MQEYGQRKRSVKKKWDTERTEESKQEYGEMEGKVKVEVAKAKRRMIICMQGCTARRKRTTYTGW